MGIRRRWRWRPLAAFLGTRPRQLVMVVAVGISGGVIGAGFVGLVHVLQRGLWPTHWSLVSHLLILIGVGLAVGLLTAWLGNPGDVELLVNNIHVLGGPDDIRDLRSLIPVSLLCIASGGAMGPEAPLVQTTGSFGAWCSSRWGLPVEQTRVLTITGMAAGFTVLFGAPLGSAIFALEILHRGGLEYYEALLPAVLGSLAGYCVYLVLTGAGLQPMWRFPEVGRLHGVDLLWALAAGAAGAGVSVLFTYLSTALRWLFRHLHPLLRPIVGGAALGGLAFWSPYALTFGEAQINPLVARHAVATVLIVAALAKLCGTAVTLSSGWRGGFIIPMFFIGATLGRLAHLWLPHATNEVVLMAAFMAAINVGVTKTPLGSTLVVTEMAGLQVLPTTMIAAVIALLLTSEVGLIHSQQHREGAYDESAPGPDIAEPDRPVDPPTTSQDGHRPHSDRASEPGRQSPVDPTHRDERAP